MEPTFWLMSGEGSSVLSMYQIKALRSFSKVWTLQYFYVCVDLPCILYTTSSRDDKVKSIIGFLILIKTSSTSFDRWILWTWLGYTLQVDCRNLPWFALPPQWRTHHSFGSQTWKHFAGCWHGPKNNRFWLIKTLRNRAIQSNH